MSNKAEDLPTSKSLSSDPYKPKSKKSHQINQLHRMRNPYSKPAGMAAIPDEEDEEEDGINNTVATSPVTLSARPAFSSYSPASMNSPNNYLSNLQADYHRRYPSKELFTIQQQQQQHPLHSSTSISAAGGDPVFDESQSKSKSKLRIASTLVVTYLIEVAIQTFFIVQCCRLLLHYDAELAAGVASWSWFLIVSGVVSSFLVTLISIIWVFRGMDFSGRVCGRLLCYVMHSFLLGMFWRYLKLAFAYDKADLEEYFKLKTIQTYVQTLPLVTIHLAWVLTTQQQQTILEEYPVESYHILSSWLVVAEMLCAVMSFLVLSTASSSSTCGNNNTSNLRGIVIVPSNSSSSNRGKSNKTKFKHDNSNSDCSSSDNNPNQHFNDSGTASTVADQQQQRNHCVIEEEEKEKSFCSFATFRAAVKWFVMCHHDHRSELGRALLLLSRLISLGMLVYKMNYYWTACIILSHLIVSSVWLGCWTLLVSTSKRKHKRVDSLDNENNKTERHHPTNKSDNQNECSSDCCETRSSTSIDSGLVKSEVVVTQSGIPLTTSTQNDNNRHHHQNPVDYDSFNGCARGYHHVDLTALSNCFTKVIIPRSTNPVLDQNATTKNGDEGWRRVRMRIVLILNRILPLSYLLFWDLNLSPVFNLFLYNKISLCETALPVLFVNAENISIIIYYLIWMNHEKCMVFLTLSSAACLLVGWTFIVTYHFQLRRYLQNSQKVQRQVEQDIDPEAGAKEHEDSGYGQRRRKDIYGGGDSGIKSIKSSMNKKETGECLSICCSSLSHPLNIKRKGHRDQPQQQPTTDNSSEDNNFCKNDTATNLGSSSATTSPSDPISMKRLNEYEDQQDLGKLMNSQSHHRQHQQHLCSHSHNSNEHSGIRKEVTKFPDLGLPSNDQSTKVVMMMHNMQREFECQENVMLMACAKSNSTNITSPPTPVTNNYTNIKEALTRKISNKSCSSSKKQQTNNNDDHHHHQHHHHHHYHHNKAMNQDECESVKGEGEEVFMEKGGKGMISSFKSSSSSSTPSSRQHQQQQPPPPPPSNSNKCMPISIKSPISWLPESCCNDSSLNSGSSNSRNTNTLVTTTTTSSKLLYCPERQHTDFDNNNVEKAEKRTASITTSRHEQRHHPHHQQQHNDIQNHPDFSIVFFEGRAGSCSRSYKQKQSRTPVASSVLLGRTARSANATPIAYTKQQRGKGGSRACFYDDEDCDNADQIVRTNARVEGSSARLRSQITGKTYLSDGASLTSLDGLCEIRASTPVEIKKASRVIVNYPPPHHQISDSKTVSRCLCKVESGPLQNGKKCVIQPRHHLVQSDEQISEGDEHEMRIVEKNGSPCLNNNNNIYEKLIDDSYGILICEGEHPQSPGSNNCIFIANDYPLHPSIRVADCRSGDSSVLPSSNQKLKILCAKCLENHDPLLTNCLESLQDHPKIVDHYAPTGVTHPALIQNASIQNAHPKSLPYLVSHSPYADSDTTDYPSDTEFTATVNNAFEDDGQSLSTHFSSATYTWHHHHYPHNNYPHHYQQQQHHQQQPTQLSQFIWAASQMMPTTTGSTEASSGGGGADQQKQCPKEFTSLEYVQTWLLASHPRTFAAQNMNHNDSRNSPRSGINNTQQQHLHHHRHNHSPQQQHENSIKARNDNENHHRYTSHKNGKRVLAPSPKNNGGSSSNIPFTNNSSLNDNKISKKKRFRQLEKRQRPIGRGASPPAKELCSADTTNANNNSNPTVVPIEEEEENDVSKAIVANAYSAAAGETRFQPPPSRKQHPLLFYDMKARQEEQKPLTATNPTTHKKCRDQLDLFHKELETVV